MTWEPADRQVSYKKTCTHFPFVVHWKHRCSCNGGGQLSQDAGNWQLCHRTNLLRGWLEYFFFLTLFFFCLWIFGSCVTYSHKSIVECSPGKKAGARLGRPFFIVIISLWPSVCDGTEERGIVGRMFMAAKPVMEWQVRVETLKTRGGKNRILILS